MNGLVLAAGLGFVAGYADATGYLHWHVFAANMTGNTVLFGITLLENRTGALMPLVPIAAFVVGSMIAAVLLPYVRPAALLVLEAALLVASAFGRGYAAQLACLALAMGVQNSSASQFDGVPANTSFITGDYTRFGRAVANIVSGRATANDRQGVVVVVPLIAAYAMGALIAVISGHAAQLSLLLVVPVVLGLAYVSRKFTVQPQKGSDPWTPSSSTPRDRSASKRSTNPR
ncbi:MAG TPA: YoaK family protein [Candidatus Elarobacter sp.]|nr:YoaK family protein [Candidatus Elarobacter sp.]